MPFGLKNKDVKLINDVFHLHSKVKEVVIFGSRAMGTERTGSDIDLAVKGEDITTSDILKIRTRLDELPLAYEVDVVNYHTVKAPEFIEHIDKHGITFYKREDAPSEWQTYKLGDLVEINKNSISKNYSFSEIEYLDTSSVTENRFSEMQMLKLSDAPSRAKRIVKNNDIVYSTVRPSQRHYGFIKDAKPNTVASTGFAVITPQKIDPSFLYYYLTREEIVSFLNGVAEANTTTFPAFNASLFDTLEIIAPEDIKTQQEIASILSSLDDKIELNLQMNQTLEAMAQAIFKEWFVNFNFPGFDGELMDGLPKGWRIGELKEIISFIVDNRGKTPPIIEDTKEGIPLIEVNALINSPVIIQQNLAKKFVDEKTYTTWFRKEHPIKGDVLFSTVGSIGEIAISFGEKVCIAQNIIALRSNFKGSFLYFTLKSIRQNLLSLDISSVQPSIKVPHLLNQKITIPNEIIINYFEKLLTPFLERIFENEMEMRTLTQLRDNLLPKLMTGKIRLSCDLNH